MEVIDNQDWLDKTAAAALLGVQIRMLEKRSAQGFIAKSTLPRLPTERTAQVRYSRADIEAFKRGQPRRGDPVLAMALPHRPKRTEPPAAPSKPEKKPEVTAVAVRDAAPASDPFAALAAHLAKLAAAFPAPEARPWLSLSEAASWSGLPAGWLLTQARAGKVHAHNVGTGAKEYWRFSREGLSR